MFKQNVTNIAKTAHPLAASVLTKFYKDWTVNRTSKMLTRKNARRKKNFIGKIVLTKCDRYWTINVSFRVLTRFYYSHLKKNYRDPGCHVFFHEYWTKNVTFRVLTKFYTQFAHLRGTNILVKFHHYFICES
ncbi:hypothetical protein DPMN_144375 [Dreissena polymorpha]|uniref:Uncharacterized protein n=1 Tax=Dreissena polymorpha TaxID=45954 RepID=A0A9D4JQ53_DREPO|nr:hypothetical protein DPMN_144375 [Dreissena polymorpha]